MSSGGIRILCLVCVYSVGSLVAFLHLICDALIAAETDTETAKVLLSSGSFAEIAA